MLIQHTNDQVRFNQQVENSETYVLPFIEATHAIHSGTTVLEVGCGEGGVLKPFLDRGCSCVGVDLNPLRIDLADNFLRPEKEKGLITLLYKNIYDQDFLDQYKNAFDIIILKDVIEHIPGQEGFITYLAKFLKEGGQIFFGFPPWYMPFGGHQQLCRSFISKLPYFHILPKGLYRGILKLAGEPQEVVTELMEIWDTSITIGQFERYVRNSGLKVVRKQHFLINPIYRYKFGLKPRKQWAPVGYIPFLRNFVTTCVYYTVSK